MLPANVETDPGVAASSPATPPATHHRRRVHRRDERHGRQRYHPRREGSLHPRRRRRQRRPDGRDGKDTLLGGTGNDTLSGATASDSLAGGRAPTTSRATGSDTLKGNAGRRPADGRRRQRRLRLRLRSGIRPARASDTITDFQGAGAATGDRVDCQRDRRQPRARRQPGLRLDRDGSRAAARGERERQHGLLGNVDADATMELRIVLHDGTALAAYTGADLIL